VKLASPKEADHKVKERVHQKGFETAGGGGENSQKEGCDLDKGKGKKNSDTSFGGGSERKKWGGG